MGNEQLDRLPGGAVLGTDPTPGSWCYAVFTVDEYGRTRGPATRRATHATTAATRLGLRLDVALAAGVVRRTIRFTSPGRPAFARADARLASGTCTSGGFGSGPALEALPAPGSPVAIVDTEQRTPGAACLGVTLTTAGGQSVTVQRDVVLENHAPALEATARANPCEQGGGAFIDWTATDPDGESADVTIAWGDGGDPESAFGGTTYHFYATPGPFTATVTARDASGGETVQALQVEPPTCPV